MNRFALCLTLAFAAAGPAAAEVASLSDVRTAPVAWSLDRKSYSTVHFDFDRDLLDAEARTKLQKQAVFINRHKGVRFAVTGHTDRVGNDAYNEALGMRRAKRVVAYLVSLGVDERQLQAMVSFGEDRPIVDVDERERRNRRVTTTVLMPTEVRPRTPGSPEDMGRSAGRRPDNDKVPDETPVPMSSTTSAPSPEIAPTAGRTSKSKSQVNAGRGNGDEPGGDPRGSIGHNRGGDELG